MSKRALPLLLAMATPALAQEPVGPPPPPLPGGEVNERAMPAMPAAPQPGEEPPAAAPSPQAGAPAGPDARKPATPPTADTFRERLSPYGSWERSRDYGWIWRPRVDAGWRPYYRGRWIWTDAGWTWTSGEPWAWATYHYGRWAWDPAAGWFWVPGYEWAPAWVTWRYGAGVIGWAPLWPTFVVAFPLPVRFFVFVPFHRFHGFPVHRFAFVPFHRFQGFPPHRFAFAPRFHAGLVSRTFPARPGPQVAARAWSGPRAFGPRPAFGGFRGAPMMRGRR